MMLSLSLVTFKFENLCYETQVICERSMIRELKHTLSVLLKSEKLQQRFVFYSIK